MDAIFNKMKKQIKIIKKKSKKKESLKVEESVVKQ